MRKAAGSLPADFRHEMLRVLSEDELVVAHGLYHGLGVPIVGCDLWRVADDKIAFYDLFRVENDRLAEH